MNGDGRDSGLNIRKSVGDSIARTPRAPQGPSDMELNAVPPDPYLPPYGGSTSLFFDMVAGSSMLSDKATGIINITRR